MPFSSTAYGCLDFEDVLKLFVHMYVYLVMLGITSLVFMGFQVPR